MEVSAIKHSLTKAEHEVRALRENFCAHLASTSYERVRVRVSDGLIKIEVLHYKNSWGKCFYLFTH